MITPDEKRMINYCRKTYAESSCHDFCSVDNFLQPWRDAKGDYLYKLFGNQLILKRHINIDTPPTQVEKTIESRFYTDFSIESLITSLQDTLANEARKGNCSMAVLESVSASITNSKNLMLNRLNSASIHTLKNDEGEEITIQNGERLTKVLGKINHLYHFTNLLDFFCTEYSKIMNSTHLEGELCLSIHPLDYLTMSDNNNNWTSCMSWRDAGEMRQGAMEMLNSPNIVVGYLASKHEMPIGVGKWNSKKFRSLYFIDKDIITNIKGYPFMSTEIDEIVVSWLKELAEKNLDYSYDETLFDFTSADNNIQLCFSTELMYNDVDSRKRFDNPKRHIGYVACPSIMYHYKTYSGVDECIACGATEVIPKVDLLTCPDCNHRTCCSICDNYIDDEEIMIVDDERICESCYNYETCRDYITDEVHLRFNCAHIEIDYLGWHKNYTKDKDIFIHDDSYVKMSKWVKKNRYKKFGFDYYMIHYSKLTDEGFRFFYPNESKESVMARLEAEEDANRQNNK